MKRITPPHEMANHITCFISDGSLFIIDQALPVDGSTSVGLALE